MFYIVNEKAVATDEVYYATENGEIFDCDYRNMRQFRAGTLYALLSEVPSTIGRMARPNNIIDRHRKKGRNTVNFSISKTQNRLNNDSMDGDSSMAEDSKLRLQRRGTVNLVKNFMFQKIQKAQHSGMDQGLSYGIDGASGIDGSNRNIDIQRSRMNNQSQAPGGIGRSSFALDSMNRGVLTPGNKSNQEKLNFQMNSMRDDRNTKTGAPVDYVMQPEDDNDKEEGL